MSSCDCHRHELLVMADNGGRLHLLCPVCGAVAWSGAALAALPNAPGQLHDGAASEHAEVAGSGSQAMSSPPCWVRDACPDQTEELDAGRKHDSIQHRTRLVWSMNGGMLGMSAVPRRPPRTPGSHSVHGSQQSLLLQPATDLPDILCWNADRVEQVDPTVAEQRYGTQQRIVLVADNATPAEVTHVRYSGAAQLPSETFAAPVAFGRYVVLGCRDNHLYCLQWS